ncbi:hypothetical protein BLOT_000771, partial [Blomia tropicalis]
KLNWQCSEQSFAGRQIEIANIEKNRLNQRRHGNRIGLRMKKAITFILLKSQYKLNLNQNVVAIRQSIATEFTHTKLERISSKKVIILANVLQSQTGKDTHIEIASLNEMMFVRCIRGIALQMKTIIKIVNCSQSDLTFSVQNHHAMLIRLEF